MRTYKLWLNSFRWPSLDKLVVNITSHPKQQSLIHLAGLVATPKAIQILTPDDSLKDIWLVDSADLLFSVGRGYIQQWLGGYCHLLVHPGNAGHFGHSVHFHF